MMRVALSFLLLLSLLAACSDESKTVSKPSKEVEVQSFDFEILTFEPTILPTKAIKVDRGRTIYALPEGQTMSAPLNLQLVANLPASVTLPADRVGNFELEYCRTNTRQDLVNAKTNAIGLGFSAQWKGFQFDEAKRQLTIEAPIEWPKEGAIAFSAKGQFSLLSYSGEHRIRVDKLRHAKGRSLTTSPDFALELLVVNEQAFWLSVPKGQGYWVRGIEVFDNEGTLIETQLDLDTNASEKRIHLCKVRCFPGATIPMGSYAEVVLAKEVTIQPFAFEISDRWLR